MRSAVTGGLSLAFLLTVPSQWAILDRAQFRSHRRSWFTPINCTDHPRKRGAMLSHHALLMGPTNRQSIEIGADGGRGGHCPRVRCFPTLIELRSLADYCSSVRFWPKPCFSRLSCGRPAPRANHLRQTYHPVKTQQGPDVPLNTRPSDRSRGRKREDQSTIAISPFAAFWPISAFLPGSSASKSERFILLLFP